MQKASRGNQGSAKGEHRDSSGQKVGKWSNVHGDPLPLSAAPSRCKASIRAGRARAIGGVRATLGYIGNIGWLTQRSVRTLDGVLKALPSRRSAQGCARRREVAMN